MSTLKHTSGILLGITLMLGFSIGCTKKRPDRFAQTQGIDAQKVSDVQSWTHTLTTKDAVFTPNKTVAENQLVVSDDLSDVINNYPLVDYKTDSELLGEDIPLRGKPNHTYQLRYELGDSLLRILKVGKKEDIPSEEWPYAVQLEDGLLGVPLVGYQVGYFDVVHAENEDRERTNTLIEKPVKDPNEAAYVRIDRSSRTVFEAIQKVDIYPAKYFEGEWFYQATVVQTAAENESAITEVGVYDTQLTGADKVRIDLDNRNTLLGVNVNQDERTSGSELDEGYVFSIPIEWKEFEAAKSGRGYGLSEKDVERRAETKRPYIKLKFEEHYSPSDEMTTNFLGYLFGKATGDQKLVDVKLAKDYFSFTLLKANQGLKVRYAFRRNINSNYKDVRSFDERDFETFGYFYTQPKVILTRDFQRKEDIQKLAKMNRFNPQLKEIVYHFSKESPKGNHRSAWVRDIARYAVHFWDQAFQKAGVNIRIRLDESKDVDLGDLRYNVIHIIDPLTYQSLGGFGPSVADPETGEIVSATANILISPYTEGAASDIRSYIFSHIGQDLLKVKNYNKGTDLTASDLTVPLRGYTPLQVTSEGKLEPRTFKFYSEETKQIQEIKPELTKDQEHLLSVYSRVKNLGSIESLSLDEKIMRFHELTHDPLFQTRAAILKNATAHAKAMLYSNGVSSHMEKRIQNECPAVVSFIAKTKAAKGEYDNKEEVQVVEECTQKLARLPILNVLLHEMGHNFSLRHNFKCSADPGVNNSNFWTADEIRREFTGLNGEPFPEEFLPQNVNTKASCVMDYMPENHGILPVPGKYDIAAIRFIYGGKVETASGQIKPVYTVENGKKEWRTIRETFGDKQGVLRPLAFCTDHDAGLGADPLCRLHDIGETPEEVVDFLIAGYWNSIKNTTYSYDRLRAANIGASRFLISIRTMSHMKRIYDEWRFKVHEFVGPNRGYLESMDSETYAKTLAEMAKSPRFAKDYALYKPARDKIINFLIQVTFMPNRYCLGLTESKALKAMELPTAIKQVGFYQEDGAIRCSDEAIQKVLQANGIDLIGEIGLSFEDFHFSNTTRAFREAPDVWGTADSRIEAFANFGHRVANSLAHLRNGGLFPAMLDEPDVRDRVLGLFTDRLLRGVNLTSTLRSIRGFENITPQDATLRLFKGEEALVNYMVRNLPRGLMIPGRPSDNAQVLGLFAVQQTNNPQQVDAVRKQGAVAYQTPSGMYAYAGPNNVISYSVIQRLLAVPSELALQSSDIDKETIAKATSEILQKFPQDETQLSLFDLFEILETGGAYVGGENVNPTVRAVFTRVLTPYLILITQGNGGQFQQVRQQYYQTVGQIAELEKTAPASVDPEKATQLAQLKQIEAQLRSQLQKVPVAKILQNEKMPSSKAEIEAAVQTAIQSIVRLKEIDTTELRAHQDVLNSAVMSW